MKELDFDAKMKIVFEILLPILSFEGFQKLGGICP